MAVKTRKPAKPIHYPPSSPTPRDTYVYAVAGKWAKGTPENWNSIAAAHGITDVWNLIFYNFQCRNPEEVNWCMHEFLKCSKSNDGKNYSFSPSDANPRIFIPPVGFTAFTADDTVARNLALDILARSEVKRFAFQTPAAKVTSALYADVVKHIKSNTILVADGTGGLPTGVLGQWLGQENVLAIRSPGRRTHIKEMTIVHEATHAGLDVQKQSMITLEGEVCGYIAEMCFSIRTNGIPIPFNAFAPALKLNPIRQWAAVLAQEVLGHRDKGKTTPYQITNTNSALHSLRTFIRADPRHGSEAETDHADDGV